MAQKITKASNRIFSIALLFCITFLGFVLTEQSRSNGNNFPIKLVQKKDSLDTNRTDKKGNKQGLWISTEQGLRTEIFYKDGLLQCVYKTYYQNGRINWIGEYKDNKPIGVWWNFNEAGYLILKVDSIIATSTNNKFRAHFIFYNQNAFIKEEGNAFCKDPIDFEFSKNGIWKYYSENGEFVKNEKYIDGEKIK